MVAHHAAKGRDPTSAESAMGAASFVNLSRIALGIEPLSEKDAGTIGVPSWDARSVFRLVGTKGNLAPPKDMDRWCRIVNVEMNNAEPPVYPKGDNVGVVEVFQPDVSAPLFPPALIRTALRTLDQAVPPLSLSKRAADRYAVPALARALGPHRGGHMSDAEAESVLGHLKQAGLVKVEDVSIQRPGKGSDQRKGLMLTPG